MSGSTLAWARLKADADLGSEELSAAAEALADERENEDRLGLDFFAFDQLPLIGSPADSPDEEPDDGGGESMKALLPGGKIVGVSGGGGGISPYLPLLLAGGLGVAEYIDDEPPAPEVSAL